MEYKSKAQEYQMKFLSEVLAVFEQSPEGKFTGRDISDKLNLISGKNGWYMHMHLDFLRKSKKLEKCPGKQGFKYKKAS